MTTHDLADVERLCPRMILIDHGRVVFDGPPTDLAAAAEGKVWVVTYATDGAGAPSDEALLVDEVPEADGRTRSRLLAVEQRKSPASRGAEPRTRSMVTTTQCSRPSTSANCRAQAGI